MKKMLSKQFENTLETAASEFNENLPNYGEIISIAHTDADGISSGLIIQQMLNRLKIPYQQFTFGLEIPWLEFLHSKSSILKRAGAIIFSDLCPSGSELTQFTRDYPNLAIYILDHHLFRKDPDHPLSENVYNCNPTQFGLHGLKEIVGATLNYLFAKAVDEKNKSSGWMAAIGMGGDVLNHINEYQSYNRIVIEEAIELGLVEHHTGLCAYGGQFERVDRGLALSILPYVPQIEGDPKKAKKIVDQLGIPPSTKIEQLSEDAVDQLVSAFNIPFLKGDYITLPKKTGILRYVFEHAHVVSILGHKNPQLAFQMMGATHITQEVKTKYLTYMQGLVSNLTTFMQIKKSETNHALFVDLTDKIPPNLWSGTGSFATINHIYDPLKALFIGGVEKGSLKFSLRCSQAFIDAHHGHGANVIIKQIVELFGGSGGGHGLAGGIRLSPEQLPNVIEKIDVIIAEL